MISGCSAVGSAPALGAGCRVFESPHSDQQKQGGNYMFPPCFIAFMQLFRWLFDVSKVHKILKCPQKCPHFPFLQKVSTQNQSKSSCHKERAAARKKPQPFLKEKTTFAFRRYDIKHLAVTISAEVTG